MRPEDVPQQLIDLDAALHYLGTFLDNSHPAAPPGLSQEDAFKLAAEDLKLYYQKAAAAQPGGSRDGGDWFWDGSRASALIRYLAKHLADSGDPALRAFAALTLVPEARRTRQS